MQSTQVIAPPAVEATRWIAFASVLALIVLGLVWELRLVQPPSPWALKVLPLCLPVSGLLKRRMYTYRWASLLLWVYFMEGVVRWREGAPALLEIALSLILFVACALHVRLRLRNTKP